METVRRKEKNWQTTTTLIGRHKTDIWLALVQVAANCKTGKNLRDAYAQREERKETRKERRDKREGRREERAEREREREQKEQREKRMSPEGLSVPLFICVVSSYTWKF